MRLTIHFYLLGCILFYRVFCSISSAAADPSLAEKADSRLHYRLQSSHHLAVLRLWGTFGNEANLHFIAVSISAHRITKYARHSHPLPIISSERPRWFLLAHSETRSHLTAVCLHKVGRFQNYWHPRESTIWIRHEKGGGGYDCKRACKRNSNSAFARCVRLGVAEEACNECCARRRGGTSLDIPGRGSVLGFFLA